MKKLLSIALLLVPSALYAQTLTGTNLVLTGPDNSQQTGGVGTNGDSSCPVLSTLGAGQFATCYFAGAGAWELGYSNGTYSPIARVVDIQAAQATLSTQITAVQATTTSLQSAVSTVQSSMATIQNSVSALQQQVSTTTSTSTSSASSPSTMMDVVSSSLLTLGSGFNTVVISTVNQDTASGFNRQTGIYTIPTTGLYLSIAKLRMQDNVPAQVSYGLGVGTVNADNPGFVWSSTVGAGPGGTARNEVTTNSVQFYTAGQQVRMYAYVDSGTPLPITWAELSIVKLGQ